MAKIISFPGKTTAEFDANLRSALAANIKEKVKELEHSRSLTHKIKAICQALLLALRHNTVKPDRFFIMYEEKDTIAFTSFSYKSDELRHAVEIVLRYKLDITGTSDDPEEPLAG